MPAPSFFVHSTEGAHLCERALLVSPHPSPSAAANAEICWSRSGSESWLQLSTANTLGLCDILSASHPSSISIRHSQFPSEPRKMRIWYIPSSQRLQCSLDAAVSLQQQHWCCYKALDSITSGSDTAERVMKWVQRKTAWLLRRDKMP